MAENGLQFALNLHQMHEDLNHLAFEMERGRKNWKQLGLSAEQKAQDAERQLEKAKQKYDSLAEQYDHAKTGDSSTRHFGLRGPRSAEQREEELQRKVQSADQDYQSKVQYVRQQRQELLSTTRPQAVKALEDLITECDAGLALQMQKFGKSLYIVPVDSVLLEFVYETSFSSSTLILLKKEAATMAMLHYIC